MLWTIIGIGCLALVANIPLGAWRARVRKFSVAWFVAVHFSVPFIITVRVLSGVSLINVPLFIALAVAGQFIGSRLFAPRSAPC